MKLRCALWFAVLTITASEVNGEDMSVVTVYSHDALPSPWAFLGVAFSTESTPIEGRQRVTTWADKNTPTNFTVLPLAMTRNDSVNFTLASTLTFVGPIRAPPAPEFVSGLFITLASNTDFADGLPPGGNGIGVAYVHEDAEAAIMRAYSKATTMGPFLDTASMETCVAADVCDVMFVTGASDQQTLLSSKVVGTQEQMYTVVPLLGDTEAPATMVPDTPPLGYLVATRVYAALYAANLSSMNVHIAVRSDDAVPPSVLTTLSSGFGENSVSRAVGLSTPTASADALQNGVYDLLWVPTLSETEQLVWYHNCVVLATLDADPQETFNAHDWNAIRGERNDSLHAILHNVLSIEGAIKATAFCAEGPNVFVRCAEASYVEEMYRNVVEEGPEYVKALQITLSHNVSGANATEAVLGVVRVVVDAVLRDALWCTMMNDTTDPLCPAGTAHTMVLNEWSDGAEVVLSVSVPNAVPHSEEHLLRQQHRALWYLEDNDVLLNRSFVVTSAGVNETATLGPVSILYESDVIPTPRPPTAPPPTKPAETPQPPPPPTRVPPVETPGPTLEPETNLVASLIFVVPEQHLDTALWYAESVEGIARYVIAQIAVSCKWIDTGSVDTAGFCPNARLSSVDISITKRTTSIEVLVRTVQNRVSPYWADVYLRGLFVQRLQKHGFAGVLAVQVCFRRGGACSRIPLLDVAGGSEEEALFTEAPETRTPVGAVEVLYVSAFVAYTAEEFSLRATQSSFAETLATNLNKALPEPVTAADIVLMRPGGQTWTLVRDRVGVVQQVSAEGAPVEVGVDVLSSEKNVHGLLAGALLKMPSVLNASATCSTAQCIQIPEVVLNPAPSDLVAISVEVGQNITVQYLRDAVVAVLSMQSCWCIGSTAGGGCSNCRIYESDVQVATPERHVGGDGDKRLFDVKLHPRFGVEGIRLGLKLFMASWLSGQVNGVLSIERVCASKCKTTPTPDTPAPPIPSLAPVPTTEAPPTTLEPTEVPSTLTPPEVNITLAPLTPGLDAPTDMEMWIWGALAGAIVVASVSGTILCVRSRTPADDTTSEGKDVDDAEQQGSSTSKKSLQSSHNDNDNDNASDTKTHDKGQADNTSREGDTEGCITLEHKDSSFLLQDSQSCPSYAASQDPPLPVSSPHSVGLNSPPQVEVTPSSGFLNASVGKERSMSRKSSECASRKSSHRRESGSEEEDEDVSQDQDTHSDVSHKHKKKKKKERDEFEEKRRKEKKDKKEYKRQIMSGEIEDPDAARRIEDRRARKQARREREEQDPSLREARKKDKKEKREKKVEAEGSTLSGGLRQKSTLSVRSDADTLSMTTPGDTPFQPEDFDSPRKEKEKEKKEKKHKKRRKKSDDSE